MLMKYTSNKHYLGPKVKQRYSKKLHGTNSGTESTCLEGYSNCYYLASPCTWDRSLGHQV